MPSGRDSFRRNRVAPSVHFYSNTSPQRMGARHRQYLLDGKVRGALGGGFSP